MKIGVVIPIWMQDNLEVLEMTRTAVRSVVSLHSVRIYVVCTRLHGIEPPDLQADLQGHSPYIVDVLHEPFVERSVAGAWNWGCSTAFGEAADFCLVMGNDVELSPGCLDALVNYGVLGGADLWTARAAGLDSPPECGVVDGRADFCCFMVSQNTLRKFGTFDENFRPAYFEDNDYFARIVQGGGSCQILLDALCYHRGSMTMKLEAEAAHHVRHWFESNRKRYADKWGPTDPPGTPEGVRERCHKSPWNDPNLPVSFWER